MAAQIFSGESVFLELRMGRTRRGSTRTMTPPMSKMMAAGGRGLDPALRGRGIVFERRAAGGLALAGAERADNCGQKREKNDDGDDVVNALTNIRNDLAEEKAAENH